MNALESLVQHPDATLSLSVVDARRNAQALRLDVWQHVVYVWRKAFLNVRLKATSCLTSGLGRVQMLRW